MHIYYHFHTFWLQFSLGLQFKYISSWASASGSALPHPLPLSLFFIHHLSLFIHPTLHHNRNHNFSRPFATMMLNCCSLISTLRIPFPGTITWLSFLSLPFLLTSTQSVMMRFVDESRQVMTPVTCRPSVSVTTRRGRGVGTERTGGGRDESVEGVAAICKGGGSSRSLIMSRGGRLGVAIVCLLAWLGLPGFVWDECIVP